MPKISIIIPVYKAEKHIKRSIESLLHQSFNDWECILVVDGSPDNSASICQCYSQKDHRFITEIKENGGVSSARNAGLDKATGVYVTFLDSDDRLAKDALLELNKKMTKGVDMAVIGAVFEDEVGSIRKWREYGDLKLSRKDDYGFLLRYGTVWGKIYRRDIIIENGLRFNETICNGEDCLFFWKYLENVDTICTSSYCGYYYYKPANVKTLTSSIGDPYKWLQSYRLLKDEFNGNINCEYTINDEDLYAIKSFIASLARNAMRAAYSRRIKRADRRTIYLEYRKIYKFMSKNTIRSKIENILMMLPFSIFDFAQLLFIEK